MKVYVLLVNACTETKCYGWHIEGIFSSFEKALAAKEKVENRPTQYKELLTRIEDGWEIDKMYF